MKSLCFVLTVGILCGFLWLSLHQNPTSLQTVVSHLSNTTHGTQTKTRDCQVNGPFPDHACTPGAVFPHVTKDQVCTKGYSSSVRNVTIATKKQVYDDYGITHHTAGAYEVDHYISLELGGSNEVANLWPEAANPIPGFHQKDAVENYLHDHVCKGDITLQQAQEAIATDWVSLYTNTPNINDYAYPSTKK